MLRSVVALTLTILAGVPAKAVEWWHDPERGCGTLAGWNSTKRISDLPGCDGALPNGAPPGEVAMHDAKASLREAEKLLDGGRSAGVRELIDRAIEFMNKAPNDPRVNWARSHYLAAVGLLTNKLDSTANKK
jgi:hypothetical protein